MYLACDGIADEIVLRNRTESVAQADAVDIQQACAFRPHYVTVRAGDVQASAGSDVLVMCASLLTGGFFAADLCVRGEIPLAAGSGSD